MAHHHFTRSDRVILQKLKRSGTSNAGCARILGFHPSTISRELNRGAAPTATGYSVDIAQTNVYQLRQQANQQHRKLYSCSFQSLAICVLLARYYSPQQIAHKLGLSHATLYRFLWSRSKSFVQSIWKYLRHKKLRRKYGTKRREKQRELSKKRWIDERPWHANSRSWYGHWEGDTVQGYKHSGYLVTLVERKSGFLFAALIPRATKENFRHSTVHLMDNLPNRIMRSITLDNGREMNDYEELEAALDIPIYFAHPYHSWERGTNENTNGLLRQFFPKNRDFSTITQDELDLAVKLINTRPRKRHDYKSPVQVLKNAGIAI
jgi:transposase, IS30 family